MARDRLQSLAVVSSLALDEVAVGRGRASAVALISRRRFFLSVAAVRLAQATRRLRSLGRHSRRSRQDADRDRRPRAPTGAVD